MLRLFQVGFVTAAILVSLHLGLSSSNKAFGQECGCADCQGGAGAGGGGRLANLGMGTFPTPRGPEYGQPDLFYNFYVPPTAGGVGAQMYMAPVPVPPHVGHTYYTYQPLMPHEILYKHKRVYHRYYNEGRGLTRTSVRIW
jgi:hypothetical protein